MVDRYFKGGAHFECAPPIFLQLAIILRITILSNDLNSETSVSYASCENCVKNENYANSDPQENLYRFLTSNRIHK